MFYTFTEKEYDDIWKEQDRKFEDLKNINRELVKRISLFLHKGKLCAVNSPNHGEIYCDGCCINELCLYENKNWA